MVEWKSVDGFNNYKVGSHGLVKRTTNFKNGKIRVTVWGYDTYRSPLQGNKYIIVPLTKDIRYPIHGLVAHAFLGPRPEGCDIHHKDFNKFNNALLNLEYLTPSEHRLKHNAIHFKTVDESLCGFASAYDKHNNFTTIEKFVTCEECLKSINERSEAYETYLNPRSIYISWDFSTKDSSLDKLWSAQG